MVCRQRLSYGRRWLVERSCGHQWCAVNCLVDLGQFLLASEVESGSNVNNRKSLNNQTIQFEFWKNGKPITRPNWRSQSKWYDWNEKETINQSIKISKGKRGGLEFRKTSPRIGNPYLAEWKSSFARHGIPVSPVGVVTNHRWNDAILVDPADVSAVGEVEHIIRRYGQSCNDGSMSIFNGIQWLELVTMMIVIEASNLCVSNKRIG